MQFLLFYSDFLNYNLHHFYTNYCTAHDGWDVTGNQGMFCPLNKPSCDRLLGGCIIGKNWWLDGVCSRKWSLLPRKLK